MCRYGDYGPYKQHYACFGCRKMFRWPQDAHRPPSAWTRNAVVPCPECKQPMHVMGWDFKAPPKADKRQWEKVRLLYAKGIRWSSCGCSGPGHNFRTLRQAREYQPAAHGSSEAGR